MLRKNLLLTTAFFVAASLSSFAAAPARSGAIRLPHSNQEFMKTYTGCGGGDFMVSRLANTGGSSIVFHRWEHVAVPITGSGKVVDHIVVEEGYQSSSDNRFSAGIYSNTPSGWPGKRIARGHARARPDCGKVSVGIPKTKLARGTKYWVVETAPESSFFSSYNQVFWRKGPKSKRKAYVQTHYWERDGSTSSHTTSPWTLQSGAPYFKLK